MKFLAIIPARGGSKRLPRKNVLSLGGKPLIAWTIDLAKRLGPSVDVLVSTDDPEIAQVASDCGLQVPWLRPAALSTDTATSVDVALHALDYQEANVGPVDGVILLQPTSPFRRLSTVQRGIELFSSHGKSAVIGVAPAQSHPSWCFTIDNDRIVPFNDSDGLSRRSQDLPPAFEVSGGLYIVEPGYLRDKRSFFAPGSVPVLTTDEVECLDIDTQWDWLCAEKAVESGLARFGSDEASAG